MTKCFTDLKGTISSSCFSVITKAATLIIIHRDINTSKYPRLSATVAGKAYLTVSRVASKKQKNFLTPRAQSRFSLRKKLNSRRSRAGRRGGRCATVKREVSGTDKSTLINVYRGALRSRKKSWLSRNTLGFGEDRQGAGGERKGRKKGKIGGEGEETKKEREKGGTKNDRGRIKSPFK